MGVHTDFDVVICGGGLAGLTLARHLKLELPALSVAVVDRLARPLPEAAFKVGESSVELGTYYYSQVCKLESYFRERHLFKLGLRFFMGGSQGPIEHRPEAGQSLFPLVPSYQIDRGRLENDLRPIVEEMGVTLLEGVVIDDIRLAEGEEKHTISCRRKDKDVEESFSLTSRWLVDASGRRRLLQTKLGLGREHDHRASAAWWRYDSRVDVEDLAAPDAQKWRSGTVEDRYFSTNHLMNKGYWVWLIPLGSGATSVGIVTDETIHPQHTYGRSYETALEWLEANEPVLFKHIRGMKPMDFLSFKNYSYASAQVYSARRWTCVGEAGFFLDPFYSPGSDMIAIGNTVTVEMIRRDRAGTLTEALVEKLNRLVLDIIFPIGKALYCGTYCTFGHAQIFTPKLAWDTAMNWAFGYQMYFQSLLFDPSEEVFALGERYRELNARVQQLFIDWSRSAEPRPIYVRGDMTRMRLMQVLALELATRRSPQQTLDVARKNLDRLEEVAQGLFWQAVQECHPEQPALKARPWINAWRMVLDPEGWSELGLFTPTTAPRPLGPMEDNFTGIFRPQSWRDVLLYNMTFNMMHWWNGFVAYRVVPPLFRRFVKNRPAMWLRKVFLNERAVA